MYSKLCWFILMKKEIEFNSISLIFVLAFYMKVHCGYCIGHLIFNLSIKNVLIIATNELKVCLPMYIISSSNFLLQNIDQCFNYCVYTLVFIQFIHLTLF